MTWMLLLSLAFLVFINRYFFLEPRVNLELSQIFRQMLQYSAPCLLTAICAPIIFFKETTFREIPLNPYFIAAILTVIFALLIKRILLSLGLSLLCFYLLQFVIFA